MKKKFYLLLTSLILVFSIITVGIVRNADVNNTNNSQGASVASCPASDQVTVSYKVYDADEVNNYNTLKQQYEQDKYAYECWLIDLQSYLDMGDNGDGTYDYEFANSCWDGSASPNRYDLYATADETQFCYDYYDSYPFDNSGNALLSFSEPVEPIAPTTKTTFVPGDNILIEVYVSCPTPVDALGVGIDISFTDVRDASVFQSYGSCYNEGINAGTYGSIDTVQSSNCGGPSIGFSTAQYPNPAVDISSPTLFCVIAAPISETCSDFSVKLQADGASGGMGGNYSEKNKVTTTNGVPYYGHMSNSFIDTPLAVTVEGAKNTTDILTPSLGSAGTVSASGSPVTSSTGASIIQGNNPTTVTSFESFTGSLTNPVALGTNVALTVNGTDSSTIQKVVAVNCADPTDSTQVSNAINSALSNVTSGGAGISGTSGGSYNIPMGDKGSTTYVAVLVKSQDESNQEIYFVQITNPLSNNKVLDSAPTVSNGVAGASGVTTTTLTPTGGNNYKLTIPDDLDSFDLTTLVSDGQTITVNGNVVTSGTNTIDVSDITGTSFTIEVEAEDGSGSTTYTINLDKLSTDTSLSATDDFSIDVNGQTFNSTGKAPWTFADVEYVVNNSVATQFSVNNLTTSSDLTFTLKDGSTTVNFGSTVSFGTGVGELTKTLDVIVTAPAGNTNTTPYTLTVKRKAASDDAVVDKSTISIYDHTGAEITDYTWTGDDCTINVKLPYAKADGTATGISIKATLPAFSTAEVGKGTALSAYTSGTTSTCYIFDASQTSVTVILVVTAQDGITDKTYTFTVEREAASQDVGLTAFEVRNEIGVAQAGSWNGTQYKLDKKLPYAPSTAGIKVYFEHDEFATVTIGTSANPTTVYNKNSLTTYNFNSSFTITIYIKVEAQADGYSENYTVVAEMEQANTEYDADLSITLNGDTYNFDRNDSARTFNNANAKLPFGTTNVTVDVTVGTSTTKVYLGGSATGTPITLFNRTLTWTGTYNTVLGNNTATLTITNEADTTGKNYTVTIMCEDPDDNHGQGYQDLDVILDGQPVTLTLNGSTRTYTSNDVYPYPTGSESGTFCVTLPTDSTNKVFDMSGNNINGSNRNLTFNASSQTTQFKILTQAGNEYTYSIVIQIEAADDNKAISDLKVTSASTGVAAVGTKPDPDTYKYIIAKSTFGELFKIDLTLDSTLSQATVSTSISGTYTTYNSNTTYNVGSTVYIKVTAQDETYTIYQVVTEEADERDTDNKLYSLESTTTGLENLASDFQTLLTNGTNGALKYTVPYTTKQVKFTNVVKATKASFNDASGYFANGTYDLNIIGDNTFKFQVIAENKVPGTEYTVIITREDAEKDNYLTSLTVNGNAITFNQTDSIIHVPVNRTATTANVYFTVSNKAVASITGGSLSTPATASPFNTTVTANGATTTLTFVVKSEYEYAENQIGRTYTVYLHTAYTDVVLKDVDILNADTTEVLNTDGNAFAFNPSVLAQDKFVVPYSISSVNIDATTDKETKVITPVLPLTKNLSATAANTIDIEVVSEFEYLAAKKDTSYAYANKKVYTLNIERTAASTENKLQDLEIYIGSEKKDLCNTSGTVVTFDPTSNTYIITGLNFDNRNITVDFTKIDVRSKVAVQGSSTVIDQTQSYGSATIDNISVNSTNQNYEIKVLVTNENGDTNTYRIKLAYDSSVDLSANCDITNIELFKTSDASTNILTPTYSQGNDSYTASVRANVSTVKVVVTKADALSTVKINGDVATDKIVSLDPSGTTTITVICIAEDEKTKSTEYKITITQEAAEQDTDLLSFTIDGSDVMSYVNGGIYYVASTVTSVNAVAVAKGAYATISFNDGITLNVGKQDSVAISSTYPKSISFIVTPEDKSISPVTYTVLVQRDEPTTFDDLEILDLDGNNLIDFANNVLTATVPYSLEKVIGKYVLTGNQSVLKVYLNDAPFTNSSTYDLAVGTNNLKFVVEALSGATTEYNVVITRQDGSSTNTIKTYITEDNITVDDFEVKTDYVYAVPRSVDTFNPTWVLTADADGTVRSTASIVEANRTLTMGKNSFTIRVVSEKGEAKDYKLTVYRADKNFDINDIKIVTAKTGGTDVLDINDNHAFVFDDTKESQDLLTVGTLTEKVYLKVSKDSQYSNVYVAGALITNLTSDKYNVYIELELEVGSNQFDVYVESEYGSYLVGQTGYDAACSKTYTINVDREAPSSDATLKELIVTDKDGNVLTMTPTFTPDGKYYVIENVGSITTVTIQAIPNVATTEVNIYNTIATAANNYKVNVDLPALGDSGSTTQYRFDRFVKTLAEDKSSNETYTIIISRDEVNLDSDCEVSYFKIYDEFGKEYFGQADFDPTVTPYNVTIPYGVNSITIEGVKGSDFSPMGFVGTGLKTIDPSWLGQTKQFEVYGQAKDGTIGTKYTFNVTFEAPNDDATLKDLKVNGTTVDTFAPDNTGPYNLGTVPNTTEKIDISPILNDENAKILNADEIANTKLTVGVNTIPVMVQAQDGKTTNTYYITVIRDSEDPYLVDLKLSDSVLLDVNANVVEFDKEVLDYYAVVPFNVFHTNITIQVPNANYITSCTNSVVFSTGEFRTFENLELKVGSNQFTINGISPEGKTIVYNVNITRLDETSADTSIDGIEVDCFDDLNKQITVDDMTLENDYSPTVDLYEYTVPNKVTRLDIKVDPKNSGNLTTGSKGATYEVFNADNLKVGKNTIVVVITAEDGINTNTIVINVTREKMSYSVNQEAYEDYKLEVNEDGGYVLDLGDKTADSVEDYTKYIVTNPEDNLKVSVLTDTSDKKCNEVVLSITDGDETEYVTITIQTTANQGGFKFDPMWILFLVCILILIIILICVNRDKYGSINKNRKKSKE